MPLRVTALDNDCLDNVARHAILRGNGYWFCTACRVFRDAAMRAVADDPNLIASTPLWTCFVSLTRLRYALGVPTVRELLVAKGDDKSYDACVLNFDHSVRWTPTAARWAFRVAHVDLLDFVALNWRQYGSNLEQFLPLIAASGRPRLLDELAAVHPREFRHPKLSNTARIQSIIIPAIRHGETGTLRWLFERMEGEEERLGVQWRERVASSATRTIGQVGIDMLVQAACTPHAAKCLGYIIGTVLPRAARVGCGQSLAYLHECAKAILLSILASSDNSNVEAWRWLKKESTSAYQLWQLLDSGEMVYKPTSRIDARRLINRILTPASEGVYRWMRNELSNPDDGWLYEIYNAHLYGLSNALSICPSIRSQRTPRAAFAFCTYMRENLRRRGVCDRQLLRAAVVDCMLHLREMAQPDFQALKAFLFQSNDMMYVQGEALEEFFARADEIPMVVREWTLHTMCEFVVPCLVLNLTFVYRQRHRRQDEATNWELVAKCLTARSNGGYGACGVSHIDSAKMSLTREVERAVSAGEHGAERVLSLLHDSGLYSALTIRDKDLGDPRKCEANRFPGTYGL